MIYSSFADKLKNVLTLSNNSGHSFRIRGATHAFPSGVRFNKALTLIMSITENANTTKLWKRHALKKINRKFDYLVRTR